MSPVKAQTYAVIYPTQELRLGTGRTVGVTFISHHTPESPGRLVKTQKTEHYLPNLCLNKSMRETTGLYI